MEQERENEKPIDIRVFLDSDNIVSYLEEEDLLEIGEEVVQGYETDVESRSGWMKANEEYIKLATQVREVKNFPWPGAANIKYPLLTEASIQFAARATAALIPGTDIVRAFVIGEDPEGLKNDRATRISKHMSYQILEQMEDWEEDQDRLLHIIPIIGLAFKKTYYNPLKKMNSSDLVLPDNLVVDYWAKGLESAWRVTEILDLSQNELQSNIRAGLFSDLEYSESLPEVSKTQNITQGESKPSVIDDSTPQRFLEQHTYLDLDDDGYYEPYIVTVHLDTKQVARIVPRFDEEGIEYNEQDEIIRIEPVQYYTKYGFLPNPDGSFYDIGYGLLLTGINETANSCTNMLLDSGTMATTGGGFLGRGIKLEGGNYSFKPNEWKQTRSTGADLSKNIVPLPVREPSTVLFQLLGLMIQSAQRLSGTIDSLMGENPGQNQKATTTQITVEQGMKVFNGLYKRTHRSMKKEFKKLFRLNKLYLTTEEYFQVLDPYDPQVMKVAVDDYQDDINVIPTADPNVSSEQMAYLKTQQLLQLMPLGLNQQEVKLRVLKAGNHYGIEKLLQPNPPAPPSLEELQFKDESERAWADMRLRVMEARNKNIATEASAIRDIAQAEAAEKGSQLQVYESFWEKLAEQEDRYMASMQQLQQGGPEGGQSGNEATPGNMAQGPGNA